MKNAINYYYNLNPNDVRLLNENYKFKIDDKYYVLYLIKNDYCPIDEIYHINQNLLYNNIYNHVILLNKYNDITTIINEKKYILFQTYNEMNRKIDIKDIIYFNNITLQKNKNRKIDWQKKWEEKIDYFEYQMSEVGHKYPIIRNSISYYIGMTENAITLLNNISDIQQCISHRRIHFNSTTFDLYNPANFVYDTKVRDSSEYFKYKFFYQEQEILNEIDQYLKISKLSKNELLIFFIRMLYPSYYFDLYEDIMSLKKEEDVIINIVKLNLKYEKLLKELYAKIANYISMPNINWLKKI